MILLNVIIIVVMVFVLFIQAWGLAGSAVVEGTRWVARDVVLGNVIVAARLPSSPLTHGEEPHSSRALLGPGDDSSLECLLAGCWS